MSIAEIFLQSLAEAPELAPAAIADLDGRLSGMLETGSRAWPNVRIPARTFLSYLAERIPSSAPLARTLEQIHGDELYLACACSLGDQQAIRTLEATYARQLDAVLAGFAERGLSREDFKQIVRRKLFVASDDGPPRITSYSGQGSLAAWIRVTARRALLNVVRGKQPPVRSYTAGDDLFGLPQSLGDPELDYLKATYREVFKDAFLEAVEALSARERTLLRQSVVHRITVRQIGRMYRVHHATAARWVAAARDALIARTREALVLKLEVSQRELDSIMGLIQSRLEVSVARVLGPSEHEPT